MGITIVRCFKCKVFTKLLGSWFFDGHVYCSTCKPDDPEVVQVTKQNLVTLGPAG